MKSWICLLSMMHSSSAFSPAPFLNYKHHSLLLLGAQQSRRKVVQTIATGTPFVFANHPSGAEETLENGLLESRVLENVLGPPPYGMEGTDIFYPSYFNGVWNVDSKTTEIQAPCGIVLFGGNNTYARAQSEINTSLHYKARFIAQRQIEGTTSNNDVIADREYNVVEIAKAAMGTNAVLDVPVVTPNKVSVVLTPNGANQILTADLLTLNRRSEMINDCEFHCSEVVRQVIAPAKKANSAATFVAPTLLKEIETASLYRAIRDKDGTVKEIRCRQRSATFLLPSQQDQIAYQMWQATRGRPVDVRFYDVVYTK